MEKYLFITLIRPFWVFLFSPGIFSKTRGTWSLLALSVALNTSDGDLEQACREKKIFAHEDLL